jgi:hypothetical protein
MVEVERRSKMKEVIAVRGATGALVGSRIHATDVRRHRWPSPKLQPVVEYIFGVLAQGLGPLDVFAEAHFK